MSVSTQTHASRATALALPIPATYTLWVRIYPFKLKPLVNVLPQCSTGHTNVAGALKRQMVLLLSDYFKPEMISLLLLLACIVVRLVVCSCCCERRECGDGARCRLR